MFPGASGGSGCSGGLGASGALRACGQRNAYGAAGERAEARGRGWVRVLPGNSTELRRPAFLCRVSRQTPAALSSVSLRCLTAYPCRAFGASLPFGPQKVAVVRDGGMSGVALTAGALQARGHRSACGAAWEWAGPTAGERAETRSVGWIRFFSANSTMPLLPALFRRVCGLSLLRSGELPCSLPSAYPG